MQSFFSSPVNVVSVNPGVFVQPVVGPIPFVIPK